MLHKKPETEVFFANLYCHINKAKYLNGRTALILVTSRENKKEGLYKGQHVAVATINAPNIELQPDEVLIKNYAQNTNIDEVLIEAKIISPILRSTEVGPICKLLI